MNKISAKDYTLLLLVTGFMFVMSGAFCQKDTIVYYKSNSKPANVEDAYYCIKIKNKGNKGYRMYEFIKRKKEWHEFSRKVFAKVVNDSTIAITKKNRGGKKEITYRYYSVVEKNLYSFRDLNEKGILIMSGFTTSLIPLHLEGELKRYFDSGKLKSIENYTNNQMTGNQNWLMTGEKYFDTVYRYVDTLPEYPGGDIKLHEYLKENIVYPKAARSNNIRGRVLIRFVILEDGPLAGAYVYKSVHPILDKEALRVVNSMTEKWSPGILDGKKVKVDIGLPVLFKLN